MQLAVSFWESYGTYIIIFAPMIISIIIPAIVSQFTDSGGWGWFIFSIIAVIAGIVCGFIFLDWRIMLMVTIPLVVLIITCVTHYFIMGCVDLEDWFIDEKGWIPILIVLGVTGIVFGFIFWIWWIMLIIVVGIMLIISAVFGILYILNKREEAAYEEALEYEVVSKDNTNYTCGNCGGKITRIVEENIEGKKIRYCCEHCNVMYKKGELNSSGEKTSEVAGGESEDESIDITDFEEEYFENCEIFDFRPYNKHSKEQIERKYKKLQSKVDRGEIEYLGDDGYDNSDEILEDAYNYFIETIGEIDNYFESLSESEIKKRYEYYLVICEGEEEDYEEDDE